uniref:Uncharacterized protein n=1 Tax=Cacopsylla melanoneura TaxID=428564 RepID=A0A8D8LH26_9HEMI
MDTDIKIELINHKRAAWIAFNKIKPMLTDQICFKTNKKHNCFNCFVFNMPTLATRAYVRCIPFYDFEIYWFIWEGKKMVSVRVTAGLRESGLSSSKRTPLGALVMLGAIAPDYR